jgi:hypothetical protein
MPARAPDHQPDPVVEAYKKDVDRTLLRENLLRTPEERLIQLQRFVELLAELRAAAHRAQLEPAERERA